VVGRSAPVRSAFVTTLPGKLIDGVFRRVLAGELSASLVDELRVLGIDVTAPAPDVVPKETWYQAISLTAARLYPAEASQAERKLGRHLIAALQSRNLVKGPWLTMAKFLGPKRALKQAAEHADGFSPVPLRVVERSSKEVEVHADDGKQPDFLAGLLEGLIDALGGKEPSVVVASTSAERTMFVASWR
jgi:uncharacterized protein (TIGR02265 family)